MKGVLHIHSTYSDGEFTVRELRQIFLEDGCRFVCISDHAEYFDADRLREYFDECKSLSDDKLFFVTGMEYTCDQGMHILGYGASRRIDSTDPETVIREIEDQGAIPVIAHPKNDHFEWIKGFQSLPRGIEAWNTKYDGRYGPRPQTFALIRELQAHRPDMRAFFGQDLHWKKQFRGLFVELDSLASTSTEVLNALSSGAYKGVKAELTLPSTGELDEKLAAEFSAANANSRRMWTFLKESKQMLDRAGIKVPESVKAQLRRIF
jgi:hypothetical protein